jgi:AmmeMemoRadiSam system protein A
MMDRVSNSKELTPQERTYLLKLARESIDLTLSGKNLPKINTETISKRLLEQGVVFVTLMIKGYLRGCVGALEAYQPLVEDVREHAVAAAMYDFRFSPLTIEELPKVEIEISRLTSPVSLTYDKPNDLLHLLRPNVDGVILQSGSRRATFLPQVWEKLDDPVLFLNQLCEKMGLPSSTWRRTKLEVFTYQVEMFHE